MRRMRKIWQIYVFFCTRRACHDFIVLEDVSVTPFGEIALLWQNFQSLWQFLKVYFEFGQILNLLWQLFYALSHIFNDVHGQM